MRNGLMCLAMVAVAGAGAGTASAQRPREDDMHERLTRRLEATIATQKQVLEDIRSLLKTSLEQNRTLEVDKVRLEFRAELQDLRATIAIQNAEMQKVRRELDESKRKIADLESQNRVLSGEADTLKAELGAQALHRQRLQIEIKQLKTIIEDGKKADGKTGGKKSDGKRRP